MPMKKGVKGEPYHRLPVAISLGTGDTPAPLLTL